MSFVTFELTKIVSSPHSYIDVYVLGMSGHVHLKYRGGVFLLGCVSEERKENIGISLRSFRRATTSLISAQLWGLSRLSSGFSPQGKSTKETDRKRVAEKEKKVV